jgi:hypothetical protein
MTVLMAGADAKRGEEDGVEVPTSLDICDLNGDVIEQGATPRILDADPPSTAGGRGSLARRADGLT